MIKKDRNVIKNDRNRSFFARFVMFLHSFTRFQCKRRIGTKKVLVRKTRGIIRAENLKS